MVVCISMLKSSKLKYVYVRDNVSIHIIAVKSIILNDVFYSLIAIYLASHLSPLFSHTQRVSVTLAITLCPSSS